MRYVVVQRTDMGEQVLYDNDDPPPAVYNIGTPALWRDENKVWNCIYRVPDYIIKRDRVTTRERRALNNALKFGLISQEEYNRRIG